MPRLQTVFFQTADTRRAPGGCAHRTRSSQTGLRLQPHSELDSETSPAPDRYFLHLGQQIHLLSVCRLITILDQKGPGVCPWMVEVALDEVQTQADCITCWPAISGRDTNWVTWRILAHMFHDDIGKMINWKGVNGKKSFSQMASKTLLLHSGRKNPVACASPEQGVCKDAVCWFNLAADGGNSKRRCSTQEVQPADHNTSM
ncbi:uncharacterized protein FYW61_019590 [Anableps anableps]